MRRSDLLLAEIPTTTQQPRLDLHSARYANLRRRSFKYELFEVPEECVGRIDLITVRFYGDPTYWWVIAQFNGIVDPIGEIVVGLQLGIPNLAEVQTALLADSSDIRALSGTEVL
jgi:hypothetical protein